MRMSDMIEKCALSLVQSGYYNEGPLDFDRILEDAFDLAAKIKERHESERERENWR